jgi:hypothetical protein
MLRIVLYALALAVTGCAGSGLRYTVEDAVIANLQDADKKGALDAQQEVGRALEEQRRADADTLVADQRREEARQAKSAADLELHEAESALLAADTGPRDISALNAANRNREIAIASVRAAEAKVDWVDAQRTYQRALRSAADRHLLAAQAHYELEKANSAMQHRVRDDLNLPRFDGQYAEMSGRYRDAKAVADARGTEMQKAEAAYNDANKRLLEMRGK